MKYELIIFDCDGTLIDSEPIALEVCYLLYKRLGIKDSQEQIFDRFAGTKMQLIIDYAREQIGHDIPFDFVEEFRRLSNQKFKSDLKVYDGVFDLLDRLEVPICIGSNGPQEKMDVTLKCTGLDQYFNKDNIFSAYDFGKWKPDPTLFNNIVSQYNIPKSKALVIDDTKHGVLGAINAGIDVFAFCPDKVDPWFHDEKVPVYRDMKSIEKQIFAPIS